MRSINEKKTPERGFFSYRFEKQLEIAFQNCGIKSNSTLLLAVSGGLDSMVMAKAILNVNSLKHNNRIYAVTVNHNLRDKDESKKDAQFVFDYCRNVLNISCIIQTIPPGHIQALAKQRGKGIEEAARYERYRLFLAASQEKNSKNLKVLTAHTRDDVIETLLMRFLQGSAASGPQAVREEFSVSYCKPLLDFSRTEIEKYAIENDIPFREDITNTQTVYLRNNMRHKLVPFLNELYPGWDKAVLKGDEKHKHMLNVIKKSASTLNWHSIKDTVSKSVEVYACFSTFKNAQIAVRVQMLYNGLDLLACGKRVAYQQLNLAAKNVDTIKPLHDNQILSSANGIEIAYKDNAIYIKNNGDVITENGLFVIIKKQGVYELEDGTLLVDNVQKNSVCTEERDVEWIGKYTLPFSIRRIRSKKKPAKTTVENLDAKTNKKKVCLRFIRTTTNE
ncbi:MAG TPA: tRNA lysidine(34) synthetase TilS [Treponemataceae bacterium]|nr:tRNA lysidine(34) synthetase TilS [Treponemataceae bacterium]